MTSNLATGLPELYAGWMKTWLDGPVPNETEATCSHCAMLPPAADGPALEPHRYFNPRVKCCSYIPALPNFLVGRILADERTELARGRESTLARLQNPALANPLWLERPSTYSYKYDTRKQFFGLLDEMVCPHYLDEQGGLCGIWRHRNGVCATWYCKHSRGSVGHRFWVALRDLLITLEDVLAQWCALELAVPLETVRDLGRLNKRGKSICLLEVEQTQPDLPGKTRPKIWGPWFGRETDYYLACARQVDALTWPEVLAVCGPDVSTLARLARQAHERHQSERVPERLRLNQFKVISMQAEYSIVESYLSSDPLKIPQRILELLPRFNGRPTPEVVTEIVLTTGLKVSPSLVRKLVDFKVLKPVDDEP